MVRRPAGPSRTTQPPYSAATYSEPWRAAALRARGRLFLELARAEGLDTGLSRGYGVVPVITENSELALRLSHALFEDGVNAYPFVAPEVPEEAARLRFFLSCAHTVEQIQHTVKLVAHHWSRLKGTV